MNKDNIILQGTATNINRGNDNINTLPLKLKLWLLYVSENNIKYFRIKNILKEMNLDKIVKDCLLGHVTKTKLIEFIWMNLKSIPVFR